MKHAQRGAAIALLNCLPRPLAVFYYGARYARSGTGHPDAGVYTVDGATNKTDVENEHMVKAVSQDILAPFENTYANKHLVYAIMELVIGGLAEELKTDAEGEAQGSVAKLLEERGVVMGTWEEQ